MDPRWCGPSQHVRRIDVSVDDSEILEDDDGNDEMDISYDDYLANMNISISNERNSTPNHSNSNSTWIFSIFFR